MTDREKVIRGLETCSHADEVGCDQCPYYSTQGVRGCQSTMQMDAFALLREPQPPTLVYCPNCGAAVEVKNNA